LLHLPPAKPFQEDSMAVQHDAAWRGTSAADLARELTELRVADMRRTTPR
jgi:hypothetical protein